MSTVDVTVLGVGLSLVLTAIAIVICNLNHVNESIGVGIATFIAIFVVIIMFEIWPESERIEYDYRDHMQLRPECLKKNPESISCINKYKDWLVDSIDLKHKLDSTKAYSLSELEKVKKK